MGIVLFQVTPGEFAQLRALTIEHESSALGPRARGYWFDGQDDFDYAATQATAQALYDAASAVASARLELSENEAHSLSLLEIELPRDGQEFAPSLFTSGATAEQIKKHLKIATRKLGATPEIAAERIDISSNDPRYVGYLQKQVRHMRAALPKVWHFHEAALRAGDGVIAIDLRARDVEIPDSVALAY